MTGWLLALVLTAPESLLTLSVARERDVLPEAPRSVAVDHWQGTVRLDVADAPRFLRRLRLGGLCRARADGPEVVELTCSERRLVARLVSDGGRSLLDLYVLRGVPWDDGGELPAAGWPLGIVAPGEECPGQSAAARAECHWREGRVDAARVALEEAREGPLRAYALLRLGELALAEGRLADAVEAWSGAPRSGPFGRVASARLCELDGACLGKPLESTTFDPLGIPEPFRTELELRRFRAWALMGHVADAARALAARLAEATRPDPCERSAVICRRVALAAMELAEAGPDGLALYLSIQDPTRGPLAGPLARAAARETERLGAPAFAARILASASGSMDGKLQRESLREAARLFVQAGDAVRADVVCRYGSLRFGGLARGWCQPADAGVASRDIPLARLAQEVPVATAVADATVARAAAARIR